MTKIKTIVAVMMLLILSACQSVGTEKLAEEAGGLSATNCFGAGGTIETTKGISMCKMQDGSFKPIL